MTVPHPSPIRLAESDPLPQLLNIPTSAGKTAAADGRQCRGPRFLARHESPGVPGEGEATRSASMVGETDAAAAM